MSTEMVLALMIGSAAVVTDLKWGTVPNWIPIAALVVGIACQVSARGWPGFLAAGLGALAGYGVFLVFYLLGGMGGGDIKLMAGFGALLGAGRLLEAALWTAGIGGLIAAVVLGVGWLRSRGRASESRDLPKTIPYAPAIALGVCLALIPKG